MTGALSDSAGDAASTTAEIPTSTAPATSEVSAPSPERQTGPAAIDPHRRRLGVIGASVLFLGVCLGFLLNTPAGLGPDEVYQLDRVVAAEHGDLIPAPGTLFTSKGVRGIEREFTVSLMRRGGPSWAQYTASTRTERPSLNELGGNLRSPNRDISNYMTQHPPLYFAVMGGLVALTPHADDLPGDGLYLLVRTYNLLLLLPLPFLFWLAARQLVGDTPVATAAAYLPLVIPGLARGAATVNNDNLGILIGAVVIWLSLRVMRGDDRLRTAIALAVLAVLGSLTKATVLTTLVIIAVAYITLAVRRRKLPGAGVIGVLVAGAAVAAVWWIRNFIVYGAMSPIQQAWGSEYGRVTGEPRPPGMPMDMDRLTSAMLLFPSRIIASLGLHEPPQLPPVLVWLVFALILGSIPAAIVLLRGRRWEIFVLAAMPLTQMLMVLANVYLHYRNYLGLGGIQGRYVYPALFGLIFPFAVVVGAVLRRAVRWTPLVIAGIGLLLSGWALYLSVEYTWLVRGTALVPSNWLTAFRTLGSFFPLSPPWSIGLALAVAACVVVGLGLTVRACLDRRPAPHVPADPTVAII